MVAKILKYLVLKKTSLVKVSKSILEQQMCIFNNNEDRDFNPFQITDDDDINYAIPEILLIEDDEIDVEI